MSATPPQRSAFPAEPVILPGRVSHVRLFPQFHRFNYPYLLVGVPVGWQGRIGLLSVDEPLPHRGWLTVDAEDHLFREPAGQTLQNKLRHALATEACKLDDYAFAYLLTTPRIFNYKFAPASFWLLYDATHALTSVLVEVNNTFDERRLYLVHRDSAAQHPEALFTRSWAKDFHVSPFSSRKGSYSLAVHDPFLTTPAGAANIRATLASSKGRAKLVARLYTDQPLLHPQLMSRRAQCVLVLSWSLAGLLVWPHILFHAVQLAFRRKLSIWWRPEPGAHTIARRATWAERCGFLCVRARRDTLTARSAIEAAFDTAIARLSTQPRIEGSPPVRVEVRKEWLGAQPAGPSAAATLAVRIMTPAFYSRLAQYARLGDALHAEAAFATPENRTLALSKAELRLLVRSLSESAASSSLQLSLPARAARAVLACVRGQRGPMQAYPRGNPHWRRAGRVHAAEDDCGTGDDDSGGGVGPVGTDDLFIGAAADGAQRRMYVCAVLAVNAGARLLSGAAFALGLRWVLALALVGFAVYVVV